MIHRYVPFLVFVFILAACSSDKQEPQVRQGASDTTLAAADKVQGSFYKRYTGTVAGKNVTVLLALDDTSLSGSYTYEDYGIPIRLWGSLHDSVTHIFKLLEGGRDNVAEWVIGFYGDSVIGVWDGGDKTYDIRLRQASIVDMVLWHRADSLKAKSGQQEPQAVTSARFYVPSQNSAPFERAIARSLPEKSFESAKSSATSLEQFWQQSTKQFFQEYREIVTGLSDSDLTQPWLNYDRSYESDIYYDRDSILVLAVGYYEYTGGAHGNGGTHFLNYDFKQQKEWKLNEMITVDSAKLIAALDRKAREYFKVPAGKPISGPLFVDKMYVPDDYFITSKGIMFNYWPYAIASYAEGEIKLFVPYSEIASLLKPAFKQRMGIK